MFVDTRAIAISTRASSGTSEVMSNPGGEAKSAVQTLRRALQSVDRAALLVEPRIMRRVIKQDRRVAGLGLYVPHQRTYTIQRDRLLVIVDRPELNLSPAAELAPTVILLAEPSESEVAKTDRLDEFLHHYWRLLFHARVHVALEQRLAQHQLSADEAFRRRQEIGATEFAEIQSVLLKDDLLLPPADDLETYIEFVAVYLELRYFAPHDVRSYFPAIRDWEQIDRIVTRDVDHSRLYHETRLPDAPALNRAQRKWSEESAEPAREEDVPRDPLQPSPPRFWRLLARAERAGRIGNGVRAAILRIRARDLALADRVGEMQATAVAELERVVSRMQIALRLDEEAAGRWVEALSPLLERAARGRLTAEARLLYDLQKVCLEHEGGIYRVDLLRWVFSGFRRPLREPLPLLRQVMMTKHLRSAARRLSTLRVESAARERLSQLMADAFVHVETQMRTELRPRMEEVLNEVGMTPHNIPQRVARRKLIEELLDRIVERGFINMGDFRDAVSKNHLKIADVAGVWEALRGNQLLRADRRLAMALGGIYRPGASYLRWPQRLSSLAFGTPTGRFLTQYVVLPYGGAFLAMEGSRQLVAKIAHYGAQVLSDSDTHEVVSKTPYATNPLFYPSVFGLGTLLLLLIHRPSFRRWMARMLVQLGTLLKRTVIDWPMRLIRSPLVQAVLQSQPYLVTRNYLLRPAMFSLPFLLPMLIHREYWNPHIALNIFLGFSLFLNSPMGRYADERITDAVVRAWHDLRIRVLAAAFHWIMDVFHQLLEALERLLYVVDEWLRFRRGDSRFFLVIKGAFGAIWSVVQYVIRFCVTLLIEPQVNPIKHFPVVTVSHKILLPLTGVFAASFEPLAGRVLANTLATATVLLLPGVFGFLVWELKENWRLFAANQSRSLVPDSIGHHGESMARLLRPGIHSGTLPKLYGRLRRASRKAGENGDWKPVNQRKAAIHHVAEAVERFVERELCGLLAEARHFGPPAVVVGHVHVASNRIEVELCRGESPNAWLAFEERGGWILVEVQREGWIRELTPQARAVWEAALLGFYKLAAVELVREQLADGLNLHGSWYDVNSGGVNVYTDGDPNSRITYPLRRGRSRLWTLSGLGRGGPEEGLRKKESPVFADTAIPWNDWVEYWEGDRTDTSAVPFLTLGVPPADTDHSSNGEPAEWGDKNVSGSVSSK
jgi:hypothetical protein